MAGLEIVVRPLIFPDIRPRARQSLPPQDDPEKGIAVISGNPAQSASLSNNWSLSTSMQKAVEKLRHVDQARTYQKDDDGTVNKANYVDTEVAKKIVMEEPAADTDSDGKPRMVEKESFYQPIKEADNIKIMRKDIIKKKVQSDEGGE